MNRALWVNRILLTALSISTGAVKLARMEDEMVIFRAVGSPDALTIAFGLVQLAGGLLLIPKQTTRLGGWIMAPTFVIATGVLFGNGMTTFGLVSILFIVMAVMHALMWKREQSRTGGTSQK